MSISNSLGQQNQTGQIQQEHAPVLLDAYLKDNKGPSPHLPVLVGNAAAVLPILNLDVNVKASL
jgi:hypothetical protein